MVVIVQLPVQSVPSTTKVASSWRGALHTILCDEVCQWLATGRWFSPGTPFYSTNKTDRNNITAILLKVALNTTTQTNFIFFSLTQPGLKPTICHTRNERTNHYNIDAVDILLRYIPCRNQRFLPLENNAPYPSGELSHTSVWQSLLSDPSVHLLLILDKFVCFLLNDDIICKKCCLKPTQQFFSYFMARTS